MRILITGYTDFDSVVSAVNKGQIFHFLHKPWEPVQLEMVIRQAVEIANRIAPEHLELEIGSPQRFLEQIKNAGAVFLGPHSPVAVGDYIAGPNHVLPAGGTARFASPLGVYDFVKTQSIIGYTKPALKNVWKDITLLAEIEGLDAHARSIDVRFR